MFLFYTNPILIAAAVLPAIFLLVHVYRADKLEKEPAPLLISLVLYGIAATFIALVLERAGSFLLGLWFEEGSVTYNAIMYFGIVAFSEEGAKYFLLRRRTWHSAAFNCQFDGVVYAVFVALGFALWENISYVLMYGLSTALVRAVTAVPGHACFGVFMGVWYGLAKRLHGQGRDGASKLCRVLALLLPALLHGCYDFIASIESVHDRWLKFVTEKYIPALRARGFGKVVFTRVLSVDAEDHFTYSLQVNADDMEAYRLIVDELFAEYAATVGALFGQRVLWFNSLMKRVEY